MERLTLPKRAFVTEGEMKTKPGVPQGALPRWAALPLDAKLPMAPGPKGAVVLCTTNVGESIHKKSAELDFDLTDPYSLLMSNGYKALHDPHLKLHLYAPQMRQRLQRGGFITHDGKVLCTLKEFNEYRQYLRKINLALDRKKEREEREAEGRTCTRRETDAAILSRQREEKVKEVQERLKQQYEEERARIQQMVREEEDRRKRMQEDKKTKTSEKEYKFRLLEQRRLSLMERRQQEEEQRKINMLQRWLEEDRRRTQLQHRRLHSKEKHTKEKLAESWKNKISVQQRHLDEEERRRHKAEALTQKRIIEREKIARNQQQKQQEIFQHMASQRRVQKEQLEAAYALRFSEKMKHVRQTNERKKRMRKQKGEKTKAGDQHLRSNWDIHKSLLQSFSDDENKDTHAKVGKAESLEHLSQRFTLEGSMMTEERNIQVSAHNLGLGDFHGAAFNPEIITVADSLQTGQSIEGLEKQVEPPTMEMSMRSALADLHGAQITVMFELGTSVASCSDVQEQRTEAMVDLVKDQTEHAKHPVAKLLGYGDISAMGGAIMRRPTIVRQRSDESVAPGLDDIAHGIVHISVYLGSQVVFPAIMRCHHGDEYLLRPTTPLPTYNVQELSGSSESSLLEPKPDLDERDEEHIDDVSPQESKKRLSLDGDHDKKAVRFSIVTELIDKSIVDEWPMEESAEDVESREEAEAEEELKSDEDELADAEMSDVRFTSKVHGCDSVELMRRLSLRADSVNDVEPQNMGTLSEILKKILKELDAGHLNRTQMLKLMEVARNVLAEDIDASLGSASSSSEEPVADKTGITYDVKGLSEFIVKQTLDRVKEELFCAAQKSTETQSSEKDLVAKENLDALSTLLVEKALMMTAGSMLKLTDEAALDSEDKVCDTHSQGSTETSKSTSSDTSQFVHDILEKVAADVRSEAMSDKAELGMPVNVDSSTYQLVKDVLNNVVDEMKQLQLSLIQAQQTEVRSDTGESSASSVDELVHSVLDKILKERKSSQTKADSCLTAVDTISSSISALVTGTLEKIVAEQLHMTASGKSISPHAAESSVTALIDSTLEKVVSELQQYRDPSETELLIRSIIDSATAAVDKECDFTKMQKYAPLEQKTSNASATSLLIQETLVKVLEEIGADQEIAPRGSLSNVSSKFAEELVKQTLLNCISNVRAEKMPAQELSDLAVAVLSSHSAISQRASTPAKGVKLVKSLDSVVYTPTPPATASGKRKQTPTPVQESSVQARKQASPDVAVTNSSLVDVLIMETLDKVRCCIDAGSMSAEDVEILAQKISEMRKSDAISDKVLDVSSSHASSEAERLVKNTIDAIVKEMHSDSDEQHSDKSVSSPRSDEVYSLVDTVLSKVTREMDKEREANKSKQNISKDEDTELEVQLQPTLGNEPLDLDPQLVSDSLMAISAKNPFRAAAHDNTERNSFLDLIHPDISTISTIDTNSCDSAKISEQLVRLSSKSLALTQAQLSQIGNIEKRKTSRSMSMKITPVTYTKIEEQVDDLEEESSSEEEDGDERLLSITDVHKPPSQTKNQKSKSKMAEPEKSDQNKQSTPKTSAASLRAAYGSTTGSTSSLKKKSLTSNKSKESKPVASNSKTKPDKTFSNKSVSSTGSGRIKITKKDSKSASPHQVASTQSKKKMHTSEMKSGAKDEFKTNSLPKLDLDAHTSEVATDQAKLPSKNKSVEQIEKASESGQDTLTAARASTDVLSTQYSSSSVKAKRGSDYGMHSSKEGENMKINDGASDISTATSKGSGISSTNEDLEPAETVEEEPQLLKKTKSKRKKLENKTSSGSNTSNKSKTSYKGSVHIISSKGSRVDATGHPGLNGQMRGSGHKTMDLTPRPSSPFHDSMSSGSKKNIPSHGSTQSKQKKSSGSSVDMAASSDEHLPYTKSVSDAATAADATKEIKSTGKPASDSSASLHIKQSLSHMSQLAAQQSVSPRSGSMSPSSSTASEPITNASHHVTDIHPTSSRASQHAAEIHATSSRHNYPTADVVSSKEANPMAD